MNNKHRMTSLVLAPCAAGFVLATVLPLLSLSASAFEFNKGDLTGSFDTTLSYGTAWRTEAQNPAYAALYPDYNAARAANKATFVNKNDGDAAFDNDGTVFAQVYKITSDLELKYSNYGALIRGTAFYDNVIMNGQPNTSQVNQFPNQADCNPSTPGVNVNTCGFSPAIRSAAGTDARLLDAYAYGNFTPGDHALNVRVGQQVISWGEALFLQGGVNSANPASLSALHLPGAELKEALLPLPMIYGSLELSKGLTMEAFVELGWAPSEPDAEGTYYSTDDAFAGAGAQRILVNYNGQWATPYRGPDASANRTGQFGVAMRYFAESLNNTEFGLYFMSYTSHLPVAQATTGQFPSSGPITGDPVALAYINSTSYSLVYPGNVHMYGLSFSTTAGELSFAGELAYRPNQPLLTELGDNVVAYNTIYAAAVAAGIPAGVGGYFGPIVNDGQRLLPGQTVQDWKRFKTYNLDLVTTDNFGNSLGSDGMFGLLEVGAEYVPDGQDQHYASTASLMNIPNSSTWYGPFSPLISASACAGPKYEPGCISEGPISSYLSRLSWGYRLALTANYNNVFNGITLNPVLRFGQDVKGNSDRTGNFLQGRKSATAGLNFIYNNAAEVGLAYNAFWGAPLSNLLSDRDNITLTAKYSF
jgi:hypothetical protein